MHIEQSVLKSSNIFATPDNAEVIHEYIKNFPKDQQLALLTVAGMTWNLCAKLTQPDISSSD
jgi:hypothetical protein